MTTRPYYQKVGEHLWKSGNFKYYYSDEAGSLVGPYGDMITATCALRFYVMTQLNHDQHAYKQYVYISLDKYEVLHTAINWINNIPVKITDMQDAIQTLVMERLQLEFGLPTVGDVIFDFEITRGVIEARVMSSAGVHYIAIMPDTIKIEPIEC